MDLSRLVAPPDFINSYSFDALSRLREIDQQGQSGGNAVAQKSIYLKLNGIGEITEIDRSNSVYAGPQQTSPGWTTVSYDATTGLLDEINNITAGTSIDDLTYTHDTLGRISTFGSIDGTATYGYDHASQIVSANYTTASGGHQPANVSFTWDANGNNADTGNVVSPNNEVTNDGTFTDTFDADGNRTARTRISSAYASDYKTTYAWDYRNRLTDVEFFDNNNVLTKHVHYVYSVYDDLIEEDIDPNGGGSYTTTEQFTLDVKPKLPVQVLSLSGTIDPSAPDDDLLEFVYGQLADRVLNGPSPSGVADVVFAEGAVGSLLEPDVTDWFLVDNQGSPTDVVDSSGNLIDHNVFSPFGQVIYVSNTGVHQLQGFSGGFADPYAGLIKFGERWYDPTGAAWISADPAGFSAGDANLYRYAGDNPSDDMDPSGLDRAPPWAPQKPDPVPGYVWVWKDLGQRWVTFRESGAGPNGTCARYLLLLTSAGQWIPVKKQNDPPVTIGPFGGMVGGKPSEETGVGGIISISPGGSPQPGKPLGSKPPEPTPIMGRPPRPNLTPVPSLPPTCPNAPAPFKPSPWHTVLPPVPPLVIVL